VRAIERRGTSIAARDTDMRRHNRELQPALPSRPERVYLRHAILHPYNMPLLVLAIAAGLISGSLTILLLAATAEAIMLGFVPKLAAFKKHVDELIEQQERAEAAKSRSLLLLRMDEVHREELERLETLVDRIRANVKRAGASPEAIVDECLGLSRLTRSYVCLAIAHRTNKEALASTNRQALEDRIHSLEAMQTSVLVSDRVKKLASKRLAIAHKRAERWDQTQDELEAIAHQLATIGELVHLVHEQSINPGEAQDMSDEIDHFVEELGTSEGALRELSEARIVEEVDPRILEKGRRLGYVPLHRV
jgi:hypothetical protein